MKISKKDAKLLYIVGGLLIFMVLYMYGYKPLQEANDKMSSEIKSLDHECKTLEIQYVQKANYEAKIKENQENINQTLTLFPAEIKEEDIVAYILNLQNAHDIEIMSISFHEPAVIVDFDGWMNVEGIDNMVHMQGNRLGTSVNYEISYEELKNVIQYIYDTQTQTTLERINVSYNKADETLAGSMEFARYSLNYDNAEYIPEELPEVAIGQEDPFGED